MLKSYNRETPYYFGVEYKRDKCVKDLVYVKGILIVLGMKVGNNSRKVLLKKFVTVKAVKITAVHVSHTFMFSQVVSGLEN